MRWFASTQHYIKYVGRVDQGHLLALDVVQFTGSVLHVSVNDLSCLNIWNAKIFYMKKFRIQKQFSYQKFVLG